MRLIVNADDFGITEGVSRGIIKGMQEGIITDTSALTNSEYFYQSVNLAKEAGILSMGVHLTITFMRPVLDVSKVKSIVDEEGNFYRKPNLIPKTYDKREVRAELKAQIEKFLSTGLQLNHIDTHHGFSIMNEEMFGIVISLAKEYGVPMRKDEALVNIPSMKNKIQSLGVKTTDDVCIDLSSPVVREELVKSAFEKYKNTNFTIEIPGHPGFVDEELRKISSLADERHNDLKLFMDQMLLKYIRDHEIELISSSNL